MSTPIVQSLVGSNRKLSSNSKVAENPTPADRRALVAVKADIAVPAADKGVATRGRSKLHVIAKNNDAAGTFDVMVYGKHDIADEWFLLEEATPGVAFETAGTWSIPSGLAAHSRVIEISGVERVFARITNTSGLTNGADLWLGSVGGFAAADR